MLAATLQTPNGQFAVRLRDVSQTGALLVSPVQPPVGSQVGFIRGGISVPATVIRVDGSNVALRFCEAIDKAALLVSIGKSRPSPKPLTPLFPAQGEAAPADAADGQVPPPALRQAFP
jgi:hypothetical protein